VWEGHDLVAAGMVGMVVVLHLVDARLTGWTCS
jgi:hypothetical protein